MTEKGKVVAMGFTDLELIRLREFVQIEKITVDELCEGKRAESDIAELTKADCLWIFTALEDAGERLGGEGTWCIHGATKKIMRHTNFLKEKEND